MLFNIAVLASLAPSVAAATVLGVTVYSRHGDRNSKHYPGYSMTNLGFNQNYQVGSDYRRLYLLSNSSSQILGISENEYKPAQIYATAPDQKVLLNAATAFLQGLYPPLESIDPSLASQMVNDGTSYTSPLNGYQYVVLNGVSANSPDTIRLKGDDECPARDAAAKHVKESETYRRKLEETRSFYEGLTDVLQDVYDYRPEDMSYANAFDIYDLINVATIHNSSLPGNVTDEELFQLRTLADSAEFEKNYSPDEPLLSIAGQTVAGAILSQLTETVSSQGKLKFSLLASSYDTFLSFFGLADLTASDPNFYGLPTYASTMAFEIFTDEDVDEFPTDTDTLNVRFLFRNGSESDAPLSPFPLFGRSELSMPWAEFAEEMNGRAMTSTEEWCNACSSTAEFCQGYAQDGGEDDETYVGSDGPQEGAAATSTGDSPNKLSNEIAGLIGALVTMAVLLIVLVTFLWMWKKKSPKKGNISGPDPHSLLKPGTCSSASSTSV